MMEHNEITVATEVVDPRGPCPECGKEAVLVLSMDRFVHLDGSDNGDCWDAGLSGEFALYQPVLDRTTNPARPTIIQETNQ